MNVIRFIGLLFLFFGILASCVLAIFACVHPCAILARAYRGGGFMRNI